MRLLLQLPGWWLAFLMTAGVLGSAARASDTAFAMVVPGIEARPGPGETLPAGQDCLRVRFSGSSLAATSLPVRVLLDDTDVSARCRRERDVLVVPLPADLAMGRHGVKLLVPTLAGSARPVEWQFAVVSASAPQEDRPSLQVTVQDATRTLYEGDELTVQTVGPIGGRAVCQVGSHISLPLRETAAGTYRGVYVVHQGDHVLEALALVRLTLPDGSILTGVAPGRLKIFGNMYTVHIVSPRSGDTVPWEFIIRGHTRPGARVSITPSFGSPQSDTGATAPRVGSISHGLGSLEVTADEHGTFEQHFGFPLHLIRVHYYFRVTAITPDGERAVPSSFAVIIGGAQPPGKTP